MMTMCVCAVFVDRVRKQVFPMTTASWTKYRTRWVVEDVGVVEAKDRWINYATTVVHTAATRARAAPRGSS